MYKKPISYLLNKTLGEVWTYIKETKNLNNYLLQDPAFLSIWEDDEGCDEPILKDCIRVRKTGKKVETELVFIGYDDWKVIAKRYAKNRSSK